MPEIIIDGKTYVASCPAHISDFSLFEQEIGPIVDVDNLNSIEGRLFLMYLCLRPNHPEITPGLVNCTTPEEYAEFWPVLTQLIPFLRSASPRPPDKPASSDGSSSNVPADSPGPQA